MAAGEAGTHTHARTVIPGSPRNGEARWPDQVVDTMSAEGRSLRVDGLTWSIVSLVARSPRTRPKSQIEYVRRRGAQKPVRRYFLFLPIPTYAG
jgi:hypothetical protein